CSQLQFIEGEIQERKVEEDPPEEREELRDPRQLEFGTILAQRYRIRKLKREGYDAFVDPVSGLIQLRASSGLTDMPSIGGRKSTISADCSKHVRGQAPAGSWFSVTTDERIRDRERLRSLPHSERKDVLSRPIWKDKGGKGHVRLAH
ncbi:hypothetical protein, partial [Pelagicoccus sp. SDUM812002]|uniref:hypothetical protein n=1 Tax=Pelagicoccus sp. SDUM812002 TaxID=3041266 RepID=UPI00280E96BC